MKKAALIMALAVCFTAGAQQKKDSTVVPPLTDSTALVSISDYDDFVKTVVQELPAKYADVIRQWWVERLRDRIAALQKKKEKKPRMPPTSRAHQLLK
jgi:uncharacterized short protein YbdD (DUF466 family)